MATLLVLYVFVFLMALAAARWLGLAMRIWRQTRLLLRSDQGMTAELKARGDRVMRHMGISVIAVLILWSAAQLSGIADGSSEMLVNATILLIALLVIVQFAVVHPAWSRLVRVAAAAATSSEASAGARKRLAVGTGTGQVLWLLFLVLVLWRALMTNV